jgi:signal peptidase I
MTDRDLAATILSIIPGLGHVLMGRRRAACIAFVVWAVLLVTTISFYYGMSKGILTGFLLSWHTMVMVDAGRLMQTIQRRLRRVLAVGLLFVILAILYALLPDPIMMVSRYPFPAPGIQIGDTVWGWHRHGDEELKRDDLVFVEAVERGRRINARLNNQAYVLDTSMRGRNFGCVVGLPGEEVLVRRDGFYLNNQLLELSNLPGDDYVLLPDQGEIRVVVPENHYFVVVPVFGARYPLAPFALREVCEAIYTSTLIVDRSDIIGRPRGVYLPFGNRHLF